MENEKNVISVYNHKEKDFINYTKENVLTGKFPYGDYIREQQIEGEKLEEYIVDAAMKYDPISIELLENVTERNQLMALVSSSKIFSRFKEPEPSDSIKFLAMSLDTNNFVFIKEPTKEMKEFAIDRNPLLIISMENVTEDLLIRALKVCDIKSDSIQIIFESIPEELKTEEVIDKFLQKDGECIKFVKNPTYQQQITAVETSPIAVFDIDFTLKDIDPNVMMRAVKSDVNLFLFDLLKFYDQYDKQPKEIKDIYKSKHKQNNNLRSKMS